MHSCLVPFTDKDECTDMSHACLEHSECVNTRGSYFCRCLPGWTGDGKTCKGWWGSLSYRICAHEQWSWTSVLLIIILNRINRLCLKRSSLNCAVIDKPVALGFRTELEFKEREYRIPEKEQGETMNKLYPPMTLGNTGGRRVLSPLRCSSLAPSPFNLNHRI